MSVTMYSPPAAAAAAAPQAAARNPMPAKKIPHLLFGLPPSAIGAFLFFLGPDLEKYKKVCRQFKRMLETNMSQQIQAVAVGARPDLSSRHSKLDLAFHLSGTTLARSFPTAPLRVEGFANAQNETLFALDREALFTSQIDPRGRHQIVKSMLFKPREPKLAFDLRAPIESLTASHEVLACSALTARPSIPIWRQDRPEQILHTITPSGGMIHTLKIHGDKLFICRSTTDSEIEAYDLETGKLFLKQQNAPAHLKASTISVAFDGPHCLFTKQYTYTIGSVGTTKIHRWDLRTPQKPIQTIRDHFGPGMLAAQGKLYTSYKMDEDAAGLRVWDISSGKVAKVVKVRGDKKINTMSFIGDDVCTVSETGVVRLWDANLNLRAKRDLKPLAGYPANAIFVTEVLAGSPEFLLFGTAQYCFIERRLNPAEIGFRPIKLWSCARSSLPQNAEAAASSDDIKGKQS